MEPSSRPSRAHKHSNSQSLKDQAATAALYVTNNGKADKGTYPLDADNKLSSASAATSLKHANPRDLPSFPSSGLTNHESSAGAAASLAAANQKTFEHWKPEHSAPANKAAMLAKDYKVAAPWQPELSSAGSKAALLAAKNHADVMVWKPDTSSEGSSAADQAMRSKTVSPSISSEAGTTPNKALMAATGAMSGRRRSGSSPVTSYTFPDSSNSAANALNAATKANKAPKAPRNAPTDLPGLSVEDATRIHNAAVTNMSRNMYTANPPVAPEVEERNHQAGLRAAAISMAKSMYDMQQKTLESHAGRLSDSHYAATSVHNRQPSISEATDDSRQGVGQYVNLQEAAQKLAAERLAKLHDANAEYRNYYGASSPTRSRLSLRGRRRSSSDGQLDSDQARSQKIRSEMSIFNNKLAEVDAKKRQKDRDSLIAAAQRNVTKSMQGMDEKVFADTGKASPAMMAEWEAKARARAEAESKTRMVNHGKVDIGGGRFMDQSEVEAIAATRVQPTLDEITKKAEADRALDEKRRLEAEEQRRIAEEKAAVERERNEKTKTEWKRFKDEEKHDAKAKKEEEKAKKAEEKRIRDEQLKAQEEEKKAKKEEERIKKEEGKSKRKSRAGPSLTAMAAAIGVGDKDKDKDRSTPQAIEKSPELDQAPKSEGGSGASSVGSREPPAAMNKKTSSNSRSSANEPSSPEFPPHPAVVIPASLTETTITTGQPKEGSPKEQGKVSSWLKSRFSRRASRTIKPEDAPAKAGKAPETAAPSAKEESASARATEPITGLPVDQSKTSPGFGTDNIPHIQPSATSTAEPAEAKEKPSVVEPITGLPMDPSKATPGFGTDNIPHIAAAADAPTLPVQEASPVSPTEADALQARSNFADPDPVSPLPTIATAATVPDPSSSERDVALAGREHRTPIPLRRERSHSTSISSMSSDEPTAPATTTATTTTITTTNTNTTTAPASTHFDARHALRTRGRQPSTGGADDGAASDEAARKGSSATQEGSSVGREEFEEARDAFDAEQLPLPSFPGGGRRDSPVRETRFREEL